MNNSFNFDNNMDEIRKAIDSKSPLDFQTSITVDRDLRNAIHALAVVESKTMKEYLADLIGQEINHLDSIKYNNYHIIKYCFDEKYKSNKLK